MKARAEAAKKKKTGKTTPAQVGTHTP